MSAHRPARQKRQPGSGGLLHPGCALNSQKWAANHTYSSQTGCHYQRIRKSLGMGTNTVNSGRSRAGSNVDCRTTFSESEHSRPCNGDKAPGLVFEAYLALHPVRPSLAYYAACVRETEV